MWSFSERRLYRVYPIPLIRKLSLRPWPSAVVIGLSLALAGCGFHLRGTAKLSPELNRTYIYGISPYSDLAVVLRQELRSNGVEVVEDGSSKATATLHIVHESIAKRVLSVGPDGIVREYELDAVVSFEVKGRDKKRLLANQTISLTREYIFDPNDVLGKSEEEQLLREDLRKDLVRLIIYRLQTIKQDDNRKPERLSQ